MKKIFSALIAVSLASLSLTADAADKLELTPYGFIKGDMYAAFGGVLSWGNPGLTSISRATGTEQTATSFTAQHTRFGLKGSSTIDEISFGGVLELDFFTMGASNANNKPRMRLGYAWVKPLAGLEIRTGQDWDLFSPLNPTTNNTNANLWYNGNYGFRRPQLQARYGMDLGQFKPMIALSVGEAAKEDELADTYFGVDNLGIPLVQGRLGTKFLEKMTVGASGMYAAYGDENAYSTWGVSVDATLPLHQYANFKGEFATGRNFNNANVFTTGGSGDTAKSVETMGVWFDVTSKIARHLNTVVGFGNESTTSDLADGAVESNMTVYGDIIVPINKQFSFCAEYQFIRTTHKGSDAYTASVIDISGKVVF